MKKMMNDQETHPQLTWSIFFHCQASFFTQKWMVNDHWLREVDSVEDDLRNLGCDLISQEQAKLGYFVMASALCLIHITFFGGVDL